MSEEKANKLAAMLGYEAFHSGGNIWLVVSETSSTVDWTDRKLICISDECVCTYEDWDAFYNGLETDTIYWDD